MLIGSPAPTSTEPNSSVQRRCHRRVRVTGAVVVVRACARNQSEHRHDGYHHQPRSTLHEAPSPSTCRDGSLVPHPPSRGQSLHRIGPQEHTFESPSEDGGGGPVPTRGRRWHHGSMDLPVFALHTVLFPGQRMALRVFEERYLLMMEDVLPAGPFVVVAIRKGQEVGGPYEANRVGVTVDVEDYEFDADGTYRLRILGRDRVALIAASRSEPYPPGRSNRSPTKAARAPTTSRRRSRPCSAISAPPVRKTSGLRSAANRSPPASPWRRPRPDCSPSARRCSRCPAPASGCGSFERPSGAKRRSCGPWERAWAAPTST